MTNALWFIWFVIVFMGIALSVVLGAAITKSHEQMALRIAKARQRMIEAYEDSEPTA